MGCPYLKEVVMLSCDAYPVKKMLPLDRLVTVSPCLGEFRQCPLYKDIVNKLAAISSDAPDNAPPEPMTRKERRL